MSKETGLFLKLIRLIIFSLDFLPWILLGFMVSTIFDIKHDVKEIKQKMEFMNYEQK